MGNGLSQQWMDTVDRSQTDKRWNDLDTNIKSVVDEFNTRLGARLRTSGFKKLDFRLIKAMVWTESGGPDSSAWKTRPMQIGNPGDPGLHELLSNETGGILTPELKKELQKGVATPDSNIKAGVAFLLMRAATFVWESVPDPSDVKGSVVEVKGGDNLDTIAKAHSTTIEMLKTLNPEIGNGKLIKAGQRLKSRRAQIHRKITGWVEITTEFAARRYNVGDPKYKQKLDYCLSIMPP